MLLIGSSLVYLLVSRERAQTHRPTVAATHWTAVQASEGNKLQERAGKGKQYNKHVPIGGHR